MLMAEHVCKSVPLPEGRLEILCDINLEVAAGESLAITGASGSGKSTLVHHVLVPTIKDQLQKKGVAPAYCKASAAPPANMPRAARCCWILPAWWWINHPPAASSA